MSERPLDELLNEATTLRKAYAIIGQQPVERFNLFRVLGLESNEVRTHSQFLAELLSPSGSHGLNEVFLDLFFKHLQVTDFEAQGARVMVEHYIGKVSEAEGGRIDVVIENKGKRLLIENKIFAGDQPNQLLRYHRFDTTARLYYLTLFGGKPSKESTGNGLLSENQYECISYANHILDWLEQCRKETAHLPLLRESIAQYIELLKQLTHQNIDNRMQTDLLNKIFSSTDHLRSFIEMQSLIKPVHERLIQLFKAQVEEIAQEHEGCWLHFYLESGKRWQGMALGDGKKWEDAGIQITFQFDTFPHGLFFGFSYKPDPQNAGKPMQKGYDLSELTERFRKEYNEARPEQWWVCYKKWDNYPPDELCSDIYSGKIKDKIKTRIETMLAMANETLKPA